MKTEKMEMVNRLWNKMGGSDAYIALFTLNEELATTLEDTYYKEYKGAQERDEEPDLFESVINPDYKASKANLIGAWAVEIERAIAKEYINQFNYEELQVLRNLLSKGGLTTRIEICSGVYLCWEDLKKENE